MICYTGVNVILSDKVMQSPVSVGGEYRWDDTNFAIIMETEGRRVGLEEGGKWCSVGLRLLERFLNAERVHLGRSVHGEKHLNLLLT